MSAFLTIAIIHMLAVMSPGPDFALCVRNSLVYSRKTGMYTAIGFALGILVHVSYSLLGIGLVISQSILLFNAIKFLGAGYLLYIGVKALIHRAPMAGGTTSFTEHTSDLPPMKAIQMGFLCNVLNPKATLFFLALFTQVIAPGTPIIVQLLYGLTMSLQTFLWFTFVSTVLSLRMIKGVFSGIQTALERTMGIVLIALGLRVALATRE